MKKFNVRSSRNIIVCFSERTLGKFYFENTSIYFSALKCAKGSRITKKGQSVEPRLFIL